MGLFDFLKKKEPELDYDPNNLKLVDLRAGFLIDFDMKTWRVNEMYEYDWGNSYFTREYLLDSGDDQVYLHIDPNDGMFLTISKNIKVRAVDQDLPEYIMEHKHAPKKLIYEGSEYFLEKETPGYFSDQPQFDDTWAELISWEYYDKDNKFILSVEQWGENDFTAAKGRILKEFEFSNIIPGN
jgi:hypothetical protein